MEPELSWVVIIVQYLRREFCINLIRVALTLPGGQVCTNISRSSVEFVIWVSHSRSTQHQHYGQAHRHFSPEWASRPHRELFLTTGRAELNTNSPLSQLTDLYNSPLEHLLGKRRFSNQKMVLQHSELPLHLMRGANTARERQDVSKTLESILRTQPTHRLSPADSCKKLNKGM